MSEAIRAALSAIGQAASTILKAVSKKDNESNSKPGIIVAIVLLLLLFMVIAPIAALSSPGLMVKNAFDIMNDKVNFKDSFGTTSIYKKCENIYNTQKNDYNEQVADFVENLKKNNPVDITEDGIPIAPEVYATISYEELDMNYLLAYLNTMYFDSQTKKKGYKFNESEARDFLKGISTLEITYKGDDPIYLRACIRVLTLEAIADKYFTDVNTSDGVSKRDMFISSYNGINYSSIHKK